MKIISNKKVQIENFDQVVGFLMERLNYDLYYSRSLYMNFSGNYTIWWFYQHYDLNLAYTLQFPL